MNKLLIEAAKNRVLDIQAEGGRARSGGPVKALRSFARQCTQPKKKSEALALATKIEQAEAELDAANAAAKKKSVVYSKLVLQVSLFTSWKD